MIDSSTGYGTLIIANQRFDDGALKLRTNDICLFEDCGTNNLPVQFYILAGDGLKECHRGCWSARRSHFDYYMEKECNRIYLREWQRAEFECTFLPYSLIDSVTLDKLKIQPNKENKISIYFPVPYNNDLPKLIGERKVAFQFDVYCKLDSTVTPKEIMKSILKQLDDNSVYLNLKKIIETNHNSSMAAMSFKLPDVCVRFGKIMISADETDVIGCRFE